MRNIALTITATTRPELLRETLHSFWVNMFAHCHYGVSMRVFINIDPKCRDEGVNTCVAPEMVDIIYKHFPDSLVYCNISLAPSFPKAFKLVWTYAMEQERWKPDYIFHLEDDWELMQDIDLLQMCKMMEEEPELLILRLSQFPTSAVLTKNWNRYLRWNGKYFQVAPGERGLLGFCGHPSLIKPYFVRKALQVLDGKGNPEKQIKGHNAIMKPVYEGHNFGVYSPQNSGPTIRDLGRPWMIKNGYRKQGPKATFKRWEQRT